MENDFLKLRNAILDTKVIEKISRMRAERKVEKGKDVMVTVSPDYQVGIAYDDGKETDDLHYSFSRESLDDWFDDVSLDDEGNYIDEDTEEIIPDQELIEAVVDPSLPYIYRDTEEQLEGFLLLKMKQADFDPLKVHMCPKCGSLSITKEGRDHRSGALHQKWYCKDCNRFSTEEEPLLSSHSQGKN